MTPSEAKKIADHKLELVKNKTTLGELTGFMQYAPRRLDVACGQNKQKGFKGIDIAGDADIKHDLFKFPWPIKSGVVQEVFCSHFLEHIPHSLPGTGKDGWFAFFDELYRVMKKGATARFIHPYVWNDRAFWDPTHVRFIHEMTYNYLNADWRKEQGLDHYDAICDFGIVSISFGYATQDLQTRPSEYQDWARTHLKNAITDLDVSLKKL